CYSGHVGGEMKINFGPTGIFSLTRRQVMTGVFAACAAEVLTTAVWGQSRDHKMANVPSTSANQSRTSLHQEIAYKASPERIYQVLLSSKDFTAFSGAAAEIDPKPGGTFSMFGGLVVGRNVELVPDQRIVQAWRLSQEFPEGTYSLVKFELKVVDSRTRVVLD